MLPKELIKSIARFCEPDTLLNFALANKETHELLFPVLQWRRKLSSKNYCAKLHTEPAEIDVSFVKKWHMWHLDYYAFCCRNLNRGDIYEKLNGDLRCYDGRNGMYRMNPILTTPAQNIFYLPPQIQVSREEFTPDYWRSVNCRGFDPNLIWFSDDILFDVYHTLKLGHIPEKSAQVWFSTIKLEREWTMIYGQGNLPTFEEFKRHPWYLSKPIDRPKYYMTEYLDLAPKTVEGYIFWVPMIISV